MAVKGPRYPIRVQAITVDGGEHQLIGPGSAESETDPFFEAAPVVLAKHRHRALIEMSPTPSRRGLRL